MKPTTEIRNIPITTDRPTNGQVLSYDATSRVIKWAISSGGGDPWDFDEGDSAIVYAVGDLDLDEGDST